ncbi:MAG: N-acetylglucosamine-6-phosphate deacetylase [Aerococcus sp.]|nr:N-acetylglucosamine-6-phosphate deacetylase [Aerococcus sp.]
MKTFYKAKKIILSDSVVEDGYLGVEDGKILSIAKSLPSDTHVVDDYSDKVLAPGYIDTHIHGLKSYDVMDIDLEGMKVMSEGLFEAGVTSWLPTTLTDSFENLDAVCRMIGDHHDEIGGAKVKGIFFEGPAFTEEHKGAQNPKYMEDPSTEHLAKWVESSKGLLKKIAIAPERDNVEEYIAFANTLGVHVTLGHSNAEYADAEKAVKAGADGFCHTYNGMSGLHHREPGMVGAALSLDDVWAELICDGYHVHPAAAKVAIKARGVDRVVLVTDSMRAGGMGDGPSKLGEFDVIVKDGAARLKDSGSLAGSVLQLKNAVKNVVSWGIASLEDAVRMASLNPAQSVGIDDECGKLAEGYDADFNVLEENGELLATFQDGEKKFEA